MSLSITVFNNALIAQLPSYALVAVKMIQVLALTKDTQLPKIANLIFDGQKHIIKIWLF